MNDDGHFEIFRKLYFPGDEKPEENETAFLALLRTKRESKVHFVPVRIWIRKAGSGFRGKAHFAMAPLLEIEPSEVRPTEESAATGCANHIGKNLQKWFAAQKE